MKQMSIAEMKLVRMDILSAIDTFCRDNDIVYSISCGTLLGAVRHGGYIPWDDDIDIYMRRTDYERFERLFPDNYHNKYQLLSSNKTPNWHLPFGKVEDISTVVFNKYVNTVPHGIDVDVFIVDEVPDDDCEWQIFRKRQLMMIQRNLLHVWKLSKTKGIASKWRIIIARLYCGLNRKRCLDKITSFVSQYNGKGYKRCFETCQGISVKTPFDKELFLDIVEWRFEDRFYLGFKDADKYLRNTFGDYMQLPPVEKRVRNHPEVAYWK